MDVGGEGGQVEVVLADDAEDVRQVVKSHLRHDGRFVVVAEGATAPRPSSLPAPTSR